jgi:hypothetical protein
LIEVRALREPREAIECLQVLGEIAVAMTCVEIQPPPEVRDQFWRESARLPESEVEFESQRAIFRIWRSDERFKPYFLLLDQLLTRSFEHVRERAQIQALLPLDNYDYKAGSDQDSCDVEDARRRWS